VFYNVNGHAMGGRNAQYRLTFIIDNIYVATRLAIPFSTLGGGKE
jgi:hypothetical protein